MNYVGGSMKKNECPMEIDDQSNGSNYIFQNYIICIDVCSFWIMLNAVSS